MLKNNTTIVFDEENAHNRMRNNTLFNQKASQSLYIQNNCTIANIYHIVI